MRRRDSTAAVAARLAALATCVLQIGAARTGASDWPRRSDAPGADGVAFVSSAVCAGCHTEQAARWTQSHHDLAMQPASPQTVRGNFDDASFSHRGVTTRFFRRDGTFVVNTEGADGQLADFTVAYTFGVEPLQQYLIAFPGGRLQALSIAWDTRKGRWFHLHPDEEIEAGDALHWTGRYLRWNAMCAECHSTNLEKHYEPATDTYRTTWAAIDVGCEACHGPGAAHLEWARRRGNGSRESGNGPGRDGDPPRRDRGLEGRRAGTDLVVHFGSSPGAARSDVTGRIEVEVCARCHSRRRRVSAEDRHGRPLLDDFVPELLRPGLYHADGQILGEVYVYGSFLQSPMYREGVRCSDCHDPHSLALRTPGDALCTRCHGPSANPRFPTLRAAAYDDPGHHHHPSGSAGARCVACHMPERTYMQVDPRRDHSFRVPRPDLSLALGTPNTCTDCHAERTASWALATVQQWDGWKAGRGRRAGHFAPALADARAGERGGLRGLVRVAADTRQPGIARATAIELFRLYAPLETAEREALARALDEPDALVRATAAAELDLVAPARRVELAAPRLDDPIRAVRTAAARSLASVPRDLLAPSDRAHFDAALDEHTAALRAAGDLPASKLSLGILYTQLGDGDAAIRAYTTALRQDPRFLPASANLANLLNRLGRNADAERVLRDALTFSPDEAEIHYSLGLLLAEEKRLDEAETELAAAARLAPARARFRYNHALALQQLGRRAGAGRELLAAQRLDPDDPDIARALAIYYVQQGDAARALPHARALVELAPNDSGAHRLLQRLEAELRMSEPR